MSFHIITLCSYVQPGHLLRFHVKCVFLCVLMSRENFRFRQRNRAKSGKKQFPADSSGMLIPETPPFLLLLQSGMLQQVIIGSSMERGRMKEWGKGRVIKKIVRERCERGDLSLICSAVVQLQHRIGRGKKQRMTQNFSRKTRKSFFSETAGESEYLIFPSLFCSEILKP